MVAKEELVKLTIPAEPRYVMVARLTAAAVAARTSLTVDEVEDLKVAVSEACTNVMDHAFPHLPGEEAPPILLVFSPQPKELRVEVTDEGAGFDPKKVVSPEGQLVDRQGGLGLYLIERLMDRVEIESAPGSGTRITMVKRASR